jgi:hypothetical protein
VLFITLIVLGAVDKEGNTFLDASVDRPKMKIFRRTSNDKRTVDAKRGSKKGGLEMGM